MEGQNTTQSHTVLPPRLVSCSFSPSFPGIGTQQPRNVTNPLLMSTLQQFNGFTSPNSNTTLLPSNSTLAINGQFTSDLGAITNMGWPTQNPGSVWLGRAKVATMLPVYGVISANSGKASERADTTPSPSKNLDDSHSVVVPTSSYTDTSNSGIFPLNPIGLNTDISESIKTQEKSLNFCSDANVKDESPSKSTFSTEVRPSSIQSHCNGELRPCSTSALSSQGSNSVSTGSNCGSVEPVVLRTDLSTNPPSYVQADVSIKTNANVDSPYVLSENLPCTSDINPSGMLENAQPFIFSAADQMVTIDALQSRHIAGQDQPVSTNETQDFQFTSLEETSGSSHDNGIDADDLPWSSIDLGDIDLFNGASAADKDVIHSVLDMDPSPIQAILNGEPPLSDVIDSSKDLSLPMTANASTSAQFNMPKFREKIKMRREKELADADKEFDRLLSLVAKRDAKCESVTTRLPPSLSALDCVLFAKAGTSTEKVSLSPVQYYICFRFKSTFQFTPPDSPTFAAETSSSVNKDKTFFFPSSVTSQNASPFPDTATNTAKNSSLAPLVFMAPIEKKTHINKVPVYRQNAKQLGCTDTKIDDNIKNDDAYSFTDDELDDKPLPSCATLTEQQLKEQRLEAEVALKLAKINCAHPKKSNSVDQQESLKHSAGKKRHSVSFSERCGVSATLTSSPAASTSDVNCKHSSAVKPPKPKSLSQILRNRIQNRTSSGFLSAKFLDDKDVVVEKKCNTQELSNDNETEIVDKNDKINNTCPPLPKLLLRIPRRPIEGLSVNTEKIKKEKKKKKKDRDRDQDWDSSEKKKRKKKHKHKQFDRQQIYEIITVDNEQWCNNDAEQRPIGTAVYSKKQRLMQWNETESASDVLMLGMGNNGFCNNHTLVNNDSQSSSGDAEWSAPCGFSQTEGFTSKGTFVVSKTDILKENCPLWRVDSQSLLQKYIPIKCDNGFVYKSISTYSGWCEQISDGYLIVKVKYIKHSRAETIVEPEVPLVDMFPAVSIEVETDKCATVEQSEKSNKNFIFIVNVYFLCNTKTDSNFLQSSDLDVTLNNSLRDRLLIYIKALLNHAVDLSFLQNIKLKNDWDYLRALNEIEKLNEEKKEKVLSHVKWSTKYIELLHFYSSCTLCDSDGSYLKCQACGANSVEKVVQLFSSESYNHDTLESEELRCIGAGSPMPATEYLVCNRCAKSSLLYHRLHHMRYLVLKQCEDQVLFHFQF
uniref:DUF4211 domain-containing protein n=1 Tax=Syphacia muris TaxID=451379 RepID=A0A0N5A9R3_9BILA